MVWLYEQVMCQRFAVAVPAIQPLYLRQSQCEGEKVFEKRVSLLTDLGVVRLCN